MNEYIHRSDVEGASSLCLTAAAPRSDNITRCINLTEIYPPQPPTPKDGKCYICSHEYATEITIDI